MLQTKPETAPRKIAALLAALVFASPANADEEAQKFEMTVIRDAAHGGKVLFGKHNEAIERINSGKTRVSETFYADTNLCVAYTLSAKFDDAETACDRALTDVTEASAKTRITKDERALRRYYALALSNRGVLRALDGNQQHAEQDFAVAMALDTGVTAPGNNLQRLRTRSTENAAN